jgi:ABC-type molybdate transport system ATPase subunit
LLELLLAEMRDGRVRFADSTESVRAYEQLTALEPEQRESGIVYKCPSGQHDDLAMSLAMLAWAAQHLHLEAWTRPIFDAHRPRRQRQQFGWEAFT